MDNGAQLFLGGKRMSDYIKRFVIACIMGLCVSLLFLGGKNVHAVESGFSNMEYTGKKTSTYEGR